MSLLHSCLRNVSASKINKIIINFLTQCVIIIYSVYKNNDQKQHFAKRDTPILSFLLLADGESMHHVKNLPSWVF